MEDLEGGMLNSKMVIYGDCQETAFSFHFVQPKSAYQGNLGISLLIENRKDFDIYKLKSYEHIVFIEEE